MSSTREEREETLAAEAVAWAASEAACEAAHDALESGAAWAASLVRAASRLEAEAVRASARVDRLAE